MDAPDIENVKAMNRAIQKYANEIANRERIRNDDFREFALEGEALEKYLMKTKLEASAQMFVKVVGKAWMKSHSS
jgi:hypothetical protein